MFNLLRALISVKDVNNINKKVKVLLPEDYFSTFIYAKAEIANNEFVSYSI